MQIKLHFFKNQERRVARFSRRSRFLFTNGFEHRHPNRVDLGRGYPRKVRVGSEADLTRDVDLVRLFSDSRRQDHVLSKSDLCHREHSSVGRFVALGRIICRAWSN